MGETSGDEPAPGRPGEGEVLKPQKVDNKEFKEGKNEKWEIKELKLEKNEKSEKDEKAEKNEKLEGKDKLEKIDVKETKENKELKNEISDKDLRKELKERKIDKAEKPELEKPPRGEGTKIPDPTTSPETREALARHADALEEAARRLRHFIDEGERPDLSRGALKDEPDDPNGG